ncbi:alpha-glucosidase [Vagococcus penaei]|uniref:Alpha-glucosidase n=1 Tax=Vagococcus penaei TaxID=633807 RepID=A0A1Q2D8G9_9ENTE|nr:alpha-glucosidase [Vagococcus penaei]AQP54601.1 alpha-glucosidase [Vagococcus penaei]RSU06686.1 alpha-glucosidase [Vagococcus penaei]
MTTYWWKNAIIYQIYPKSFKDTNADGIGDIQGIIDSLPYIKSLGVNTLWLNPIFISPQIDNGYDVSNYYAIDELFGSLADVEQLIAEAHALDLKIIFDLVLNHTSNQHPWFQEALKGPDNMYRDYYLWTDAPSDGTLPNNWASFFGGSVWEKDATSNQFYFHLFAKEMPDLNWKNPEVQKAMVDMAKFWLSKGIDGFRLDAFIHMIKADFALNVTGVPIGEIAIAEEYYANLPEVKVYLEAFIQELREVKPDIFIVGEAASATPDLALDYIGENLCSTVISFDHIKDREISGNSLIPSGLGDKTLHVPDFKERMSDWQSQLIQGVQPTLYWNNHDMPRLVSRFGDEKNYRTASCQSLAVAMYLLRGIPVILYGEEIGMKNVKIDTIEAFQDPMAKQYYQQLVTNGFTNEDSLRMIASINKEASRGGMQWDDTTYAGFSTVPCWSGVNVEKDYNVAAESENENSVLAFYQELLRLKKDDIFQLGETEFIDTEDTLIAYKRILLDEEAIVVCHVATEPTDVPLWLRELDNTYQVVFGTFNHHKDDIMQPYDYLVLSK